MHVANDLAHDPELNFDPKMGTCLDAIPKITEGLEVIVSGNINPAELIKKGTHLLFDFKDCAHLLTSHVNLGEDCRAQISDSFASLKKGVSHLKSKVLHKIPHPHFGHHHKKHDKKEMDHAEEGDHHSSPFFDTIAKVKGITGKCGGNHEGGEEVQEEQTDESSGSGEEGEGETESSGSSEEEETEATGTGGEEEQVEDFIF